MRPPSTKKKLNKKGHHHPSRGRPDLAGWLTKKNRTQQALWQYRRRFFTLHGRVLHYYVQEGKQERCAMVVHEIITWPGKENGLIFKGPSSELFALADSWTEAARWLSVLQHKPSRTIRAAAGTEAFSVLVAVPHDKPKMRDYSIGSVCSFLKHGATFLASDLTARSEAMMISSWASADCFNRWYTSSDYQPWKGLRATAASSRYYLLTASKACSSDMLTRLGREGVFVLCETHLPRRRQPDGWVQNMTISTETAGGAVVAGVAACSHPPA